MLEALTSANRQELPVGTPLVQCGARGRAWLVVEGRADFFLARRGPDGAFESRRPLFRVEAGGVGFDLPEVSLGGRAFTPVFVPAEGARCAAFNAVKLGAELDADGLARLSEARDGFSARLGCAAAASFEDAWRSWELALRTAAADESAFEPVASSGGLTDFEVQSLHRGVVKRAVTDPAFRRLLAADPRAAAKIILGRPLPDDFSLRIEFEKPDETLVVLRNG
jgi:hypothetical protein